jgi:hypothetical protein
MSNGNFRPRLQLIRKPQRISPTAEHFVEESSQSLLFPLPIRDLLIFVVFPLVNEEDLTKPLEIARPCTVLELRRSPRFDIGRLNRRLAFEWFEAIHSKYYDLPPMLSSGDKSSRHPVELVAHFLKESGTNVSGPVMILLSQTHAEERDGDLVKEITRLFSSASHHPWKTITFPQFVQR